MRVKCHRSGWNVIQKLQNRWETKFLDKMQVKPLEDSEWNFQGFF